jgi:hypothetical protein
MATAGLVCSIISLAISLTVFIACMACVACAFPWASPWLW